MSMGAPNATFPASFAQPIDRTTSALHHITPHQRAHVGVQCCRDTTPTLGGTTAIFSAHCKLRHYRHGNANTTFRKLTLLDREGNIVETEPVK